jgi:hypothetical protein
MRRLAFSLVISVACGAACSSDDNKKACDPVAQTGCDSPKICEAVMGGDPVCASPLVLRGKVFGLADGKGIAGARVVALDVNGAPVSSVATTGTDGAYELTIPTQRMADGTPIGANVKLRADAQSFLTFPSGIRQAIPVDTGGAVLMSDKYVVASALTDIGLIAASIGSGAIAGTVEVAPSRAGVLVVAESSLGVGTAIADVKGDYKIFNLVPGQGWTVTGYAHGVSYAPGTTTVETLGTAQVDLKLSTQATSKVSGSIEFADAPGGSKTSVILVVERTFNETLARGENPPGLRAGDVTGSFLIDGVPAGKYVVLAAFENDGLVRDPDTGISGTAIVHQTVTAGQDVAIAAGFKVTGALDVIAPGKDLPQGLTAKPTLTWKDDSSEEMYHIDVFDALGIKVWMKDAPRETGKNPEVPYDGPFMKGMYYQFRAYSERTKGSAGLRPISATEDLRGVFYAQ